MQCIPIGSNKQTIMACSTTVQCEKYLPVLLRRRYVHQTPARISTREAARRPPELPRLHRHLSYLRETNPTHPDTEGKRGKIHQIQSQHQPIALGIHHHGFKNSSEKQNPRKQKRRKKNPLDSRFSHSEHGNAQTLLEKVEALCAEFALPVGGNLEHIVEKLWGKFMGLEQCRSKPFLRFVEP